MILLTFIVCMFSSLFTAFCSYKLKEAQNTISSMNDELREYQSVITKQNNDIIENQTEINELVQILSRESPIRCITVVRRINRCIAAHRAN